MKRQTNKKIAKYIKILALSSVLFSFVFAYSVPLAAYADNGTAICAAQNNPNSNIGVCINHIYVIALALGGTIAVGTFVVAGYLYMSGGDGVGTAKKMISSAIAGLIILFGTYVFLNTINPDLTNFSGNTLPDISENCGGTAGSGGNSCLPSVTSPSNGNGTPTNAGQITIRGSVSSNNNVELDASVNNGTAAAYDTWQWASNGTALTSSNGGSANSASIDTTMDDNSSGTHVDNVSVTASSSTGAATPISGSATFTIVFDAGGNATSVTMSNSSNSCPIVANSSNPVSPASLQNTCFGNNATAASEIAQAESSGNPQQAGDHCVENGGNYPASIGYFQINLSAPNHMNGTNSKGQMVDCSNAFDHTASSQTYLGGVNFNCTVTDQTLYNSCVQNAINAQNNINAACQISNNGNNWSAWSTHTKCGL